MSVFRCYSEKKPGFDVEARGLCGQLREQLGIDTLEGVRILNRYDADRIAPEVYEAAKTVVFSEPQVDDVYDETFPIPEAPHSVLAVEALPGQYDQRADSCAQCNRYTYRSLSFPHRRRQGVPADGDADGGRPGQDPPLPHQPGGEPGGLHGQARHPGAGARGTRLGGCGGGIYRPG